MDANKLTTGWRIGLILSVVLLITHCFPGSGGQGQSTRFDGVFTGTVAEDGLVTATGWISAVDDNDEPVPLRDEAETVSEKGFGTYRVFDGQWAYTLNNAHEAVQSLGPGESIEDTFPIRARDKSARTVRIRIDGAEDAPLVVGDDSGVVAKGRWTTVKGDLVMIDVDSKDQAIGFGDVPPTTGRQELGTFELHNGTWTYKLVDEDPRLEALETGEFLVDSHVFEASEGSQFEVDVLVYSVASPNLVVVLADDLGFADVGFNGSQDIPTPNIDSIAANGVHFFNGTTSHPGCSPTRAGLLTGRYQQRFGHLYNPEYAPHESTYGLPLGEVLLSDVLADAGYVTGIIGKWHLGAAPHFHPNERGFQEFYGFLGGGHDYFSSANDGTERSVPLLRNDTPEEKHPGYLTDVFSREAADFIERHAVAPFYLYLSYNAPHTPLEVPTQYKRRFSYIEDTTRRTYAAMVSALDDGVGQVIAALRERELLESTLIIFLGDNGGNIESGAVNGLRDGKGALYEGGIRAPFAMQWLGMLPEGVRYEKQVSSIDVFPTIAAAAGASPPTDRTYDGVNLLPYLQTSGDDVPHEQLFWRHSHNRFRSYAVREQGLKLVSKQDGKFSLYDLLLDPLESNDISAARPNEVRRMRNAYSLWNSEMTAPPAFPPKQQ